MLVPRVSERDWLTRDWQGRPGERLYESHLDDSDDNAEDTCSLACLLRDATRRNPRNTYDTTVCIILLYYIRWESCETTMVAWDWKLRNQRELDGGDRRIAVRSKENRLGGRDKYIFFVFFFDIAIHAYYSICPDYLGRFLLEVVTFWG